MSNQEKRLFIDKLNEQERNAYHLVWNMIWRCADMSASDKFEALSLVIFAMDMALVDAGIMTGGAVPPTGHHDHMLIERLIRTQKYAHAAMHDMIEHDVNVFDPDEDSGIIEGKKVRPLRSTEVLMSDHKDDVHERFTRQKRR